MDTEPEVHNDQTPLNPGAEQKPKKESKKKAGSVSPTEMFEAMYGARAPTQEQSNSLKIRDSSPVPKKVVALIKRRMNGAQARVESASRRIQAYRQVIRTRRSVDDLGHEMNLPQSDVAAVKIKLLEARAGRMKAQETLAYNKQIYEEAIASRAGQLERGMRSIRKEKVVTRETPQLVKRSMELLNPLGANGAADEIGSLRSAAKSGNWVQFKQPFLGFVATHDPVMSDRLNEIPSLRHRVIIGTMRELKKSN